MTTATPQVLPGNLPDELKKLYDEAMRHGRTLQQKNAPTPDEFNDVEKIEELGLGSAHVRGTDYPSLWVTDLHKLFTTVHCGDPTYGYYASIHVPLGGSYERSDRGRDWPLLATAFGTQLELGDNRSRLIVRHDSATDFEHDRARLLTVDLDGPIELSGWQYAPTMGFVSRIQQFRAWPLGTALEDMGDDESDGMCEDTEYFGPDHEPHRFISYVPDNDAYNVQCDALADRKVYFELTPAALVDDIGRLKKKEDG